jgi:hypothetical protein
MGMFILYLRIKFHKPSSKNLLCTVMKPKAIENVYTATMFFFYTVKNLLEQKLYAFRRPIIMCHFRSIELSIISTSQIHASVLSFLLDIRNLMKCHVRVACKCTTTVPCFVETDQLVSNLKGGNTDTQADTYWSHKPASFLHYALNVQNI